MPSKAILNSLHRQIKLEQKAAYITVILSYLLIVSILPFGLLQLVGRTTGNWLVGPDVLDHIGLYPFLIIGLPAVILLIITLYMNRKVARLARQSEHLADVNVVGMFIEGVKITKSPEIVGVLIPLLQQIKYSEASLIKLPERRILYNSLKSDNLAFVLAILQALKQINDTDAIPYVEKVAHRSKEPIKTAANNCLMYLHAQSD